MFSLLVLLLVNNVKSQSYCVSGRYSATNFNIGVNGLYSYDGNYNGKASYTKTTDCASLSTLYLYRVGSQWRIGEKKADNVGYIAYCTQNSLSSCTSNTWTIIESDGHGGGVNRRDRS